MANRLRPTAVTFTPFGFQSDAKLPLDNQQPDTITPDGSDPPHVVSQTDTDCIICTTLGRMLDCCQTRTNSCPCPEWAELGQLFTREKEKYEDEIAALRDKLRQMEQEAPEDQHTRLCAEMNKKIDELKSEVEKAIEEDESLMAENKELEKKLKRLEAEIQEAQPAAEFAIKEAKRGKTGKKT